MQVDPLSPEVSVELSLSLGPWGFSNYLPIFDLFLRVSEVAPRRSWRDTL